MIKLKDIIKEIKSSDINAETKNFSVKFGSPNIDKDAAIIYLNGKYFAHAVPVRPDWMPDHVGEWYVNRAGLAIDMKYPAQAQFFKNVQEMLDHLEKWLLTKSQS